ncbi:MAG TPA: ABC transporter permease, partial [bacterium]|nr:ABC transporter permease [bacterium]
MSWPQLRRRPVLLGALGVLALLYAGALFADFIAPCSPETMRRKLANRPPSPPAGIRLLAHGDPYRWLGIIDSDLHLFALPDGAFLLGSDMYGRDQLSRLIHGSRISLTVGLIGVAISFTIGLLVGGIAGYCGGRTDALLMRLCEIIISFPGLYLILALRGIFPMSMSSGEVYLMVVV